MKKQLITALSFSLLVSGIAFSGCANARRVIYKAHYNMQMSADTPKNRNFSTEYKKVSVSEHYEKAFVYNDDDLSFSFNPSSDGLNFTLTNNMDSSVRIIWNKAALIDEMGRTSNILHTGVKFVKKDEPQLPTTVIKGSTLKDMIIPANAVHWYSGTRYSSGGWETETIFPSVLTGLEGSIEKKADRLTQQLKDDFRNFELKILLPIEKSGTLEEYLFTFRINNVDLVKSIVEPKK